jgi:hypothetical protein
VRSSKVPGAGFTVSSAQKVASKAGSGAVFEEDQRVEAVAEDGLEVEGVDCDDAVGLVGKELSPRWAERRGAGSTPAVLRISPTAEAPTRCPSMNGRSPALKGWRRP